MSNFICEVCNAEIYEDRNTGRYITGCEHYPDLDIMFCTDWERTITEMKERYKRKVNAKTETTLWKLSSGLKVEVQD